MRKVIKNVLKVAGAVAVLAFATFDTGTIINPIQVTTPSGKVVSFQEGESVNIKDSKDQIYILRKNDEDVQVTKNNVLLREIISGNNVVKRITALRKNKDVDDNYRFLLEDEEVEILNNEGVYSLVKTEDNLQGYALTTDLSVSVVSKINLGFIQTPFTFGENNYKNGDAIVVNNYKDGCFYGFDTEGNSIVVSKDNIRFQDEFLNRSDDELKRLDLSELNGIIALAKKHLGKPYVYGASGPNSFDCSGFTTFVFKQIGIKLPRTSASQSRFGQAVNKSDLRAGDLVFFNTSGAGVSHVGIYIGNGQFIHSATSVNPGVVVDDLNSNYYLKAYICARRVL